MALNGDNLGLALKAAAAAYNNVVVDTTDAIAMAAYQENFWKAIGNAMVSYITANADLNVPGVGLAAPSGGGPVTGNSTTGTIS